MDKQKKNLLVFGYGLALILLFFAVKIYKTHEMQTIVAVLLVSSFVLFLLTLIKVELLLPFYKKWMIVAYFIGTIVTGVILSTLFYVVFALGGIILRLLGKDLLDRKINGKADSYWIKKEQGEFKKEYCTRQF